MESHEKYPEIYLNDGNEDSFKNGMKFYHSNKPASFDDSSRNLQVNTDENCNKKVYLTTPSPCVRRYSDTSISKFCETDLLKLNNQLITRKRFCPRQFSIQKPPALDEISIDILKANCSFGGFKQLQKVNNVKKECKNEEQNTISIINGNPKVSVGDLENVSNNSENFKMPHDAQSNRFSMTSSTACFAAPAGTIFVNYLVVPQIFLNAFLLTLSVSNRFFYQIRANNKIRRNDNCQNGFRLGYRKTLQERRRRISDYSLCSAVFGIITMILMTEFQWAGVIKQNSNTVYFLKSLITLSTLVLIIFILTYHVLVIQLFSCDDCLEDWRITITWQRIGQMILELGVCAIHPIPFLANTDVKMAILDISHQHMLLDDQVSLDLILSLPMFLRLYLVFRVILLHSKLFSDAGLRSIGAINKVNFDTRFLLKTLLTICPATVFILFVLSMWLFFSWILRACEIRVDPRHNSLLNSTWLIAITFLSVGYGEMVPHTACGRCIAISSGVMGSACTALIVAVLAKKLELTKAEQHVTYFILNNKIKKKMKNCAANVLRETWLIYKFTKLVEIVDLSRIRAHQRKFLKAIHGLRKIKIDQRKLTDNSNTLVDFAKTIQTGLLSQPSAYISMPVELYRETQHSIFKTVTEMRDEYTNFHKRIENIESSVINLQRCLTHFTVDIQKSHQI